MSRTGEVQAGEPLRERLINWLNIWKQIGAKEVVESDSQQIQMHIGSQRTLEMLCSVTREESSAEGKVHFRAELDKGLKKGDKWRKILDCRRLQEEIVKIQFKMKGVRKVIESMQGGEFATTLDLKSAYHHVKAEKSPSPYMGFSFDNRSFMYVGKPFRQTRSPAIFCNVLRPDIKEIRERWGLRAISYIDDILLIDQDKEKLGRGIFEVMKFLEEFSWLLALDK
ncbi:MAG: hypothetical protein EZS28_044862 [Streblomastix strix]|uniref:Reverse transcriptase domain-containing protein n=1 Tax=Streblomastix strix TaxID=222440 RepID=A0A5J4TP13_9EUKA|nr:MAG: hypothetical protein EZS28_044862 [Streblomastix strix]